MKTLTKLTSVAIASLMLPVATLADDQHGCDAALNDVQSAIEIAIFIDSGNARKKGADAETNRSNLLAKLDDARAKVGLHKWSDAIDKLTDISDKATLWTDADKQKLEDASEINYAVSAGINCIGNLGAAAP